MVFVLNKNKKPLDMCTEAKARYLLNNGYAVVHKMYPFTIRLKQLIEEPKLKSYTIKIDAGSIHTGIAIIDDNNNVCFLAELEHRTNISMLLKKRSDARGNRRNREVRHRRCKFGNQRPKKNTKKSFDSNRKEGWLPPSVKSVLDNISNLVKKVQKICNITSICIENVKFDTQLLENPDIQGVEYQQGELYGYEVKEYLLYKFGHVCQYCKTKDEKTKKIYNASKDTILEVEHMDSKTNGGSNRIKNLNIACHTCNQDKGSLSLKQWFENLKKSKSKLNKIRTENIKTILDKGAKPVSYKYTAKINSMRNRLYKDMHEFNLSFEAASGGKTKMNRINQELPKQHYYDALCVGNIPTEKFNFKTNKVFHIKACGRGSRLRGKTNACGIITDKNFPRKKLHFGFQTGDIVKANVTSGTKIGVYIGRMASKSDGNFKIYVPTLPKPVQCINHRFCKLIQRNDGYNYHLKDRDNSVLTKVS